MCAIFYFILNKGKRWETALSYGVSRAMCQHWCWELKCHCSLNCRHLGKDQRPRHGNCLLQATPLMETIGSSRGQHTLYLLAIMTNAFLFGRHTEDTSRQRIRIFMRLKKKKRSIYDLLAKLNEISLMAINIQEACLKSLKKDSKKEGTCQPILLLLRTQEPITTLLEH